MQNKKSKSLKKSLKMEKRFLYFKKFRAYMLPILNSLGVFRPIDAEHTIRVCWMTGKSKPRVVTEQIFIDLFDYSKATSLFMKELDVSAETVTGRTKVYQSMSKANDCVLNLSIVKKVLGTMSRFCNLKGKKFKCATYEVAIEAMPKNTSSSFPDYITPKSSNANNVFNQVKRMLDTEGLKFINECLVCTAWRTQINRSNKLKFRQFYPVPHVIQLVERKLFHNMFVHFDKNKMTPYAYSNIFSHLSERYAYFQKYNYQVSLDISAFDMNISHDLILIIFKWVRGFLELDAHDSKLYDLIVRYHLNAYISLSVGETQTMCIFSKKRGLLSGSTLTNMFGSFVNMFTIVYFCISTGKSINSKSFSVHGDDSIVCFSKITMSEITSFWNDTFGMIVSAEKSEIFKPGQRIYFLGHFYDSKGRYLNRDRLYFQLIVGSPFINNSEMTTEERILSKLCSLLFKCTDGMEYFLSIKDKLLGLLNLSELPEYYKGISVESGIRYQQSIREASELWRTM